MSIGRFVEVTEVLGRRRQAETRERWRELAFLGWQHYLVTAGKHPMSYEQYLANLGLREGGPAPRTRETAAEIIERMNTVLKDWQQHPERWRKQKGVMVS